jgi:hypothetical protein
LRRRADRVIHAIAGLIRQSIVSQGGLEAMHARVQPAQDASES